MHPPPIPPTQSRQDIVGPRLVVAAFHRTPPFRRPPHKNENNKHNKNKSASCSGIQIRLKQRSSYSSSNYLPELLPNSPETTIFAPIH